MYFIRRLRTIQLVSKEGAQNAPSPITTYALFFDGNYITNEPILPEHINCQGCRVDGVKTVFCDSLCPIPQCALQKGVTTCGGCLEPEPKRRKRKADM